MKKENKKEHRKAKQEEVILSKKEYEGLSEKAKKYEEYYDKWLRVHADFQNTRKRLEKEKLEFLKFANEDLVLQLLPIIDNFDRALNADKNIEKDEPHLKGILLIKDDLHRLLENYGVVKLNCVRQKFNPELHEAVMVVESEEHPEGTVVEELQAGYTMHGKLIRPASVKVSKKREEKKDV